MLTCALVRVCVVANLFAFAASQQAINIIKFIFPRQPLEPGPILKIVSILGEVSHSKAAYRGKVDYRVQRAALERLSILIQAGAVSKRAINQLGKMWSLLARGLDYATLR